MMFDTAPSVLLAQRAAELDEGLHCAGELVRKAAETGFHLTEQVIRQVHRLIKLNALRRRERLQLKGVVCNRDLVHAQAFKTTRA